jgi:hypothetical protein
MSGFITHFDADKRVNDIINKTIYNGTDLKISKNLIMMTFLKNFYIDHACFIDTLDDG